MRDLKFVYIYSFLSSLLKHFPDAEFVRFCSIIFIFRAIKKNFMHQIGT